MASNFTMRPATRAKDDGLRLLRNVDSQLPWLSAVGSGEQWGSSPRSTDPERLSAYRDKVDASEAASREPGGRPWTADSTRAWVVETAVRRSELLSGGTAAAAAEILGDEPSSSSSAEEAGDMVQLPVAAVIIEGKAADYVRSVLPAQDDADPFVFVKYLLTDRRAGALAKGAGAFALRFAVERARELGFRRVCLDCWAGNGGRLVRYYEEQGFTRIGDFEGEDTDNWPGTVLEMRL